MKRIHSVEEINKVKNNKIYLVETENDETKLVNNNNQLSSNNNNNNSNSINLPETIRLSDSVTPKPDYFQNNNNNNNNNGRRRRNNSQEDVIIIDSTNDPIVIAESSKSAKIKKVKPPNHTNKTKNVDSIQTNNDLTKQTPSVASHLDKDISFIMNLFPDVNTETATKVSLKIDELHKSETLTKGQRENYLALYIIENNLNIIKKQQDNNNNYFKLENDIQPTNSNMSVVETNLSTNKNINRIDDEMDELTPNTSNYFKNNEDNLNKDFEKLNMIIKDCDPTYLIDRLNSMSHEPNKRVEIILTELLEKPNYPKLKDYLNKKKKEKEIDMYVNSPLNIEEFLKIYPNPTEEFFGKNDKEMTQNYKLHCEVELMNKFKIIAEESIIKVLKENNYHLSPSYRQLENAIGFKEDVLKTKIKNHVDTFLKKNGKNGNNLPINVLPKAKFSCKYKSYKLEHEIRADRPYPNVIDERFFKELQFIRNESNITNFLKTKKKERETKFEEAKKNNSLLVCTCCYSDELLDEDMLSCPSGHRFCKECIKRYAETSIGDCKYNFKCISENCGTEFELSTLKVVLQPNLLNSLLKNIRNEEIRKANIEGLEYCSHCDYGAIIDDPDLKVFYCLNQDCLKETCRLCKESNHLPLKCSEIESKKELDLRTMIENKVTEAMIRVCYKCGKRFYKTEGCNMMHCVCGASMCYVCRKPISDYKHFSNTSGCQQYSDVAELHYNEMEKAYKEVKEKYLKENPEATEISLKYDPIKILDEAKKALQGDKDKLNQQMIIFNRGQDQFQNQQNLIRNAQQQLERLTNQMNQGFNVQNMNHRDYLQHLQHQQLLLNQQVQTLNAQVQNRNNNATNNMR